MKARAAQVNDIKLARSTLNRKKPITIEYMLKTLTFKVHPLF